MSDTNDEIINFARKVDLEEFRDYFDSAVDLGVLEKYRSRIEKTKNLESLRPLFEKLGSIVLPGFRRE